MSLHNTLSGADIHTPYRAIYTDGTARAAESGFSNDDVDKIALQQSDNTTWVVTAVTAGVPTWAAIGGTGTGDLLASNNLSDLANAGTARSNLGLGTAATHSSSDYDAAGAASTAQSTAESFATSAITALSLGTASTHAAADFAFVANNLSDLANSGTARTNLGLGTSATHAASDFDMAGAAATALSDAEASAASLYVPLTTTYTLAEDTDVDISEPTDGQVLTYNSGASKWENADASGGSSISTSTVTATTSSLADSAADNAQVLDTGHAGQIGAISVDHSAYVRIYSTADDATADTRTAIPSDGGYVAPGTGADTVEGLLWEYWFAPGSLTPNVRPFGYYSADGSGLPCKITNTSGATTTITLTTKLQQVVS